MRFEATCRFPLPMYRWIVLVSTCQVKACSGWVIHTTVPPYRTRASSPCLYDFFLRVWLLGKHFCMVSEQRFFQLLHWQAYSYWEKATCSVVASHCMIKHDLMFSQMSLLLLLPGLLLRPRLWLLFYLSRTKFCSAQVEREIIEVPGSPCFIQREQWLFVLPV